MPTKIKKAIYNKNIHLFFNKGDRSIFQIKNNIIGTVRKLVIFYNIKNPKINIELIYSRKELDDKFGHKTPKWLVAVTRNNRVYLFSPSVIEKVSFHKKKEVRKILVHELCHIFNGKINKNGLMWIDEGTALFLAKQKRDKTFTKKDIAYFSNNYFDRNIKLIHFAENNGYEISYWSIKNAVKINGINIIARLLKINPKKEKSKEELKEIFNDSIENFLIK